MVFYHAYLLQVWYNVARLSSMLCENLLNKPIEKPIE